MVIVIGVVMGGALVLGLGFSSGFSSGLGSFWSMALPKLHCLVAGLQFVQFFWIYNNNKRGYVYYFDSELYNIESK